jgi:hypothetical protein
MEVTRLFRSFGSSSADNPARDHHATLINEAEQMTLGPVREQYRARHAQPDDDADAGAPPAPTPQAPADTAVSEVADEWAIDDWDAPDDDFRFVVRPYSWTRGRTRPVQDLAIETLVSTSDEGRDMTSICSAEHAAIAELCTEMRSVAEVAALLSLPLGVARVLLADMIDTGLVHVHRNPMGWGDAPDLALLERVLDGLYRL